MASDEQILNEADYYLEHASSIAGASKDLGISRKTLHVHFQKLEEIDPVKAKLVRDKITGSMESSVPIEQIISEVDYYLNHANSIEEASKDLGISKRTLQLHFAKLAEIAPEKAKLVTEKKAGNARRGSLIGGSKGKRKAKWTSEQAEAIATIILENEMTYEEAEDKLGISASTLYEMMSKGVDADTRAKLDVLAQANKKGVSVDAYIAGHRDAHITTDMIVNDIHLADAYSKKGKK